MMFLKYDLQIIEKETLKNGKRVMQNMVNSDDIVDAYLPISNNSVKKL